MSVFLEIENAYRAGKGYPAAGEIYRAIEDKSVTDKRNRERSLYHLAAEYGDVDAIELLLACEETANVQDDEGETPLHALARGNRDVVVEEEPLFQIAEKLLDARVSPMKKDSMGNTCYHTAAMEGCYPVVQALAARGARLNATNSYGKNILHLATYYCGLNKRELDRHQNRIDEIRKLYTGVRSEEEINRDIDWDLNAVERYGRLDRSYFAIIRAGQDAGLDAEDKDEADKTAIDYAVDANYGKLVLLLKGELDETGPPEELEARITAGGKTLHQAVREGDVTAVQALLQLGVDKDEVMEESPFIGQSPLMVACVGLRPEMVELLLQNGADPNLRAGEAARTAMFWLLRYAAPKEEDLRQKKVQNIIKQLLGAGAGVDDSVDDYANTALNIVCAPPANIFNAMRYGNNSLQISGIEALVAAGGNVNTANLGGVTPLMNLCLDNADLLENQLITLLESGADIAMQDKSGNNAFMVACANTNKTVAVTAAQLMLDFGGFALDTVNNQGLTALDYAVQNNNEVLVKLLLEQGG